MAGEEPPGKEYRTNAKVIFLATFAGGYKPRFKSATVQFTWYAKTAAHPDGDNAIASLKAGIDGLTDAGLFEDDKGLTFPPVIFAKDATRPRVFVSVTV